MATEIGNHKNVTEYDGAFHCCDCHAEWGALTGAPYTPPMECEPPPVTNVFNNAVMCMVLDKVTGQPERIPPTQHAVVSREDAEAYTINTFGYWQGRLVIVKLACLIPREGQQ